MLNACITGIKARPPPDKPASNGAVKNIKPPKKIPKIAVACKALINKRRLVRYSPIELYRAICLAIAPGNPAVEIIMNNA